MLITQLNRTYSATEYPDPVKAKSAAVRRKTVAEFDIIRNPPFAGVQYAQESSSVLNQKFLFTLGLNHDGAAAKPFDGGQDVVGGFGPAEGLGVGIAGVDVGGDGGLQRGG